MIVKKAQDEGKDFYDVLTYYLDLCRKIHIRTLEYLAHKKAGINPLGFCEGGFYGGHFKENEEIGREFFRPMTVSFVITSLNEATMMYKGKSLYEDKAQFTEEVLSFVNDYANKYKKRGRNPVCDLWCSRRNIVFRSGRAVPKEVRRH